ncbi:MAG: MFS transporter [Lentisphaerae bacterium]|nr:MFS transporter [Lentisphaerota bacterium]
MHFFPDSTQKSKKRYSVGSLQYTGFELLTVSFWLLWGIFWFDMISYVLIPTLLPLTFKSLGASGAFMGIMLGSIPSAINLVMNPILSTLSDRTRTRWGRRTPYLAFAIPFVAVFSVLLGWIPECSGLVSAWFPQVDSRMVLLIGFCAASLLFNFFSLVIGSISCYLPPDVIPVQFIGRIMTAKMIVFSGAGFFFNFFLMQFAANYARWLYTGIGIAFAVSFTLMCIFVKEGEYPQPEKQSLGHVPLPILTGKWINTYFRDCFNSVFFLLIFLGLAITQVSTLCRGMFNILFATRDLMLTEAQYGHIIGLGSLLSLGVALLTIFFIDKVNAMLLYIGSGGIVIILNIWGYFGVHDYMSFMITGLLIVVTYSIQGLCFMPMLIMIFPKDKFGQFCSANALCCCFFGIVANWGCGVAVDWYGYRFIYVWDFLFTVVATIILLAAYWKWKRQNSTVNRETI